MKNLKIIFINIFFFALLLFTLELAIYLSFYKLDKKCKKDFDIRTMDPVIGDFLPNVKKYRCDQPIGKAILLVTDQYGCRVNENEYLKNTDYEEYIYFSGDSFTYSYTDNENSISEYYKKLAKKNVVNCGVPGFGVDNSFSKLKKQLKLRSHKPSKIIYLTVENDLAHETYLHKYANTEYSIRINQLYNNRKDITLRKKNVAKLIFEKILNKSALYIYVSRELKPKILNSLKEKNPGKFYFEKAYLFVDNKLLTEDGLIPFYLNKEYYFHIAETVMTKFSVDNYWLRKIKQYSDFAEKNNIEFYHIFIQETNTYGYDNIYINKNAYIKDQNINSEIFYRDYITASFYNDNLVIINDGHLNEKGNEEYAKFIYDFVDLKKTPKIIN